MTTYTATISHHSISRAREITINGQLASAKKAAAREFGTEQRDYTINIYTTELPNGQQYWEPMLVAWKAVGARKWSHWDDQ